MYLEKKEGTEAHELVHSLWPCKQTVLTWVKRQKKVEPWSCVFGWILFQHDLIFFSKLNFIVLNLLKKEKKIDLSRVKMSNKMHLLYCCAKRRWKNIWGKVSYSLKIRERRKCKSKLKHFIAVDRGTATELYNRED